MDLNLNNKLESLKAILQKYGSVAIAFSGGVDSALLLKVAHDTLGDNAIALTIRSSQFPSGETEATIAFCKQEGIRQIFVDFTPFTVKGFLENQLDRCYHCKKAFLTLLLETARRARFENLLEGSNLDDENDYRPGMRAIKELGIKSPLREALLTKDEIRKLSRSLGLPTWNKQSLACLASRIAFGEPITNERLIAIDKAEKFLQQFIQGQVRVRLSGGDARIEIEAAHFNKVIAHREELLKAFSSYGFKNISLDLNGYRTGSMSQISIV